MPAMPYPISGKAYDTDGTTALASTKVICRNVTNNESQTTTTNASGEFTFDASNFTSGYTIGDECSLFTSYGSYYVEYIFEISGGSLEHDLTLATEITSAALYTSVSDVRAITGVSTAEFSDVQIYKMIQDITNLIDERTGKTWKGIQTVTDEYYDGDDTDLLWLDQTNIRSVTAVSIDENQDGIFTDITITKVYRYEEGYIVLDRNAEITVFTAGPQLVKVSYTYGNSTPTETIKLLTKLMVANLMHFDNNRVAQIDTMFQKVRWIGPRGLA